jgi:hypothetical protein
MDNDRHWQVRPAPLPDQVSGLIGDLRVLVRAFTHDQFGEVQYRPEGYVWLAVEDEEKLRDKVDEAGRVANEVCGACNDVMQRLNQILPLAGKYAQPEKREARYQDGEPAGEYAGSACEEITALRYQAERCLHAAYQNIAMLHCDVEAAFACVGVRYQCPPDPCAGKFAPYQRPEPEPVGAEPPPAPPAEPQPAPPKGRRKSAS